MTSFQPPASMRAVVYKGPFEVAVEDKPYPRIQNPTDCVLKVTTSALCGSDLHFYRGQLNTPAGFICGHEFVGEIVEKGGAVTKFAEGDKVSLSVLLNSHLLVSKSSFLHSVSNGILMPTARHQSAVPSCCTSILASHTADIYIDRLSSRSTPPAEAATTASAAKHLDALKVNSLVTRYRPIALTADKQSMCACLSATLHACTSLQRSRRRCSC